MGLMGFVRSGIRQHWHIWEVMRDTSEFAATPPLGYAAQVISWCVVIFLGLVGFIFWVGSLAEKPITSHPRQDSLPSTDSRLASAPTGN